jgi:hypothetical protein
MKIITHKTAALAFTGICALAFIAWRARIGNGETRPRDYDSILADSSGSTTDLCGSVARLAAQAVASSEQGNSFDLTFYRTGDAASANEPVMVERFHLTPSLRALESRNAPAEQRKRVVEQVEAQCRRLTPTEASPIFQGVRTVVQQMRAEGCGKGGLNCRLFIQSDLQELAEPGIRDAINSATAKKRTLPSPIDNAGVTIKICGYAQTTGSAPNASGGTRRLTNARDARLNDRLREVWHGLFTHPELIELAPFCQ